MSVGVERLFAYVPAHRLPIHDPASAGGLLGTALAVPGEDAVTMAATAVARLLAADAVEHDDVDLLVTATSHPEPVSPVVHRLVGLGPRCRVLDVRHPGCGGASALLAAADWVRAGGMRARRAVVVAADAGATGAGAVAALVGGEPRALVFADDAVAWTGIDDAAAIDGAFGALRARERPELERGETLTDRLARVAWAAPTPDAARAAHGRVLERDWREDDTRWAQAAPRLAAAVAAAAAEQVEPALAVARHAGDTGAASLGLALAALLADEGRVLSGRRVGCFAAGGGSAVLFTALVSGRAAVAGGVTAAPHVPIAPDEIAALRARTAPPAGFAGDFVRAPDGAYRRVG